MPFRPFGFSGKDLNFGKAGSDLTGDDPSLAPAALDGDVGLGLDGGPIWSYGRNDWR